MIHIARRIGHFSGFFESLCYTFLHFRYFRQGLRALIAICHTSCKFAPRFKLIRNTLHFREDIDKFKNLCYILHPLQIHLLYFFTLP